MALRSVKPSAMSASLALGLTVTDVAFLIYWTVAALHALNVIQIPAEWLYANADDARVVAWNWSFFPLDVAFSLTGLAAVRLARRNHGGWRPLALISLILTMVAGGMAVAYWTLLREFDPFWIGTNAVLLVWPVPFVAGLVRDLSVGASTVGGETAKDAP